MITKLIAALQAIKLELSAEELADLLWLATRITPGGNSAEAPHGRSTPQPITVPSNTTPDDVVAKPQAAPGSVTTESLEGQGEGSAGIYDRGAPRSAVRSGIGATRFRAPRAPALPEAAEIARALRPLRRRTLSTRHSVLDEDGTARHIAETGLRTAITRPADERLFDAALIIDESTSTAIWRQTVRELQTVLERQGAFGRLRVWWLDTNRRNDSAQLYAQPKETAGRQRVAPRELIDMARPKLYLIVSDCVASPWHTGAITRDCMLPWGQHGVVSILQLLPQRLWRRTALGATSPVRLRAFAAGDFNNQLLVSEGPLPPEQTLAVPVVTFEPQWLRAWARALTGTPGAWTPGRLMSLAGKSGGARRAARPLSDDPDMLVRDFRASASPTAQRLAERLSVLPHSSLAVMHLVRETTLPEARQSHLAEVFLSGLLRMETPATDALDPENEQYEFLAGVPERLAGVVSVNATFDVLDAVSGYVERRGGQALDFRALLADPDAAELLVVDKEMRPFAEISARALRRFGGQFARVADALTAGGGSGGTMRRVTRIVQPHPGYTREPPRVSPELLSEARRRLEQLRGGDVVPEIASELPSGSRVPFLPHTQLIAEPEDLRAILGALSAPVERPAVAIAGTAASGKSQLAIEIAYRLARFFAGGVFWVSCGSAGDIATEVASCGATMSLRPDFSELPIEEQVELTLQQWRSALPRLVIFDDCEDEATLVRWRPPDGGTHLLLTSRNQAWSAAAGIHVIELASLSRPASVQILLRYRPDLAEDQAQLSELITALGNSPVALKLAGSYLAAISEIKPGQYLKLLRAAGLRRDEPQANEDSQNVLQSIVGAQLRVALTTLPDEQAVHLSRQLLARLVALPVGPRLPEELVIHLGAGADESATSIQRCIDLLNQLGIIERVAAESFQIHPLVTEALRGDPSRAEALEEAMIGLLTYAQQLSERGQPAALIEFQPLLRGTADAALIGGVPQAAALATEQGSQLLKLGELRRARSYLVRARAEAEQRFGPDDLVTATSLNALGALHRSEGTLDEALELYARALAIRELRLEHPHPDQATSLNNIGVVFQAKGDYEQARPLLERAVSTRRALFGDTHPSTVTSLNNLAAVCWRQDDSERASQLFQEALRGSRADGVATLLTATTLNNLASMQQTLGHEASAYRTYREAYNIYRDILGPDHPETTTTLSSLAVAEAISGDILIAASRATEALASLERYLGSEHARSQLARSNLAAIQRDVENRQRRETTPSTSLTQHPAQGQQQLAATAKTGAFFPRGQALVIGVSSYGDPR